MCVLILAVISNKRVSYHEVHDISGRHFNMSVTAHEVSIYTKKARLKSNKENTSQKQQEVIKREDSCTHKQVITNIIRYLLLFISSCSYVYNYINK